MQTSDQSSEEKQPLGDQTSEISDVIEQEALTSSDTSLLQMERQKADKVADKEAIRRGLIYPPPPSFYEEMPTPPVVPAHVTYAQSLSNNVIPQSAAQPDSTFWQAAPPQSPQPTRAGYPLYPQGQNYAGMQAPPFVAGPPPTKKPRKWLLVTLAVLAAIMLLSCGLCAWVGVPIFRQVYSQVSNVEVDGLQVVNDYYGALQNKQYAQAYRDLDTQGALKNISQAEFISQAEKQDSLYGPVLRYTPGQPDLNGYDGNTISTFSLQVDVARNKQSYTTQLQFTKVNDQWKISNYNHL